MESPGNHPGWLRAKLVAGWQEIIAVLLLSIGYFVLSSSLLALDRWNGHIPHFRASNYSLLHLIAVQSCLLALLFAFLHWRGWQSSDFRIAIDRKSTVEGFLLLFAWIAVETVFSAYRRHQNFLHPPLASGTLVRLHHPHLGWALLILSQIVNALSEELVVMGYAFHQFAAKRGPKGAFFLTTLLRISYHTYKSPLFLLQTTIDFLIFGAYYQRTRNLWPLLVAHTLYDINVFASSASGLF